MSININEIFEKALKDPKLLSTIDVNKLITEIEDNDNSYLDNKDLTEIQNQIITIVNELNISIEEKKSLCDKLIGYRYVDEIHELHKGKHVRWLRESNNKLTNGGIVVDIKFTDNGLQVLCMNSQKRFIQYKFDECKTFQKLTEMEQLIIMSYQCANNVND